MLKFLNRNMMHDTQGIQLAMICHVFTVRSPQHLEG